jgi:uncharacterized protein (TIGR00297 family)
VIWDVAALGTAGVVVWTGRRQGWITPVAAGAAAAVGLAVWAGSGPSGVGLLLLFFVTSSLLGRAGRERGAGEGPRSARQVAANGGVAALSGLAGAAGFLPAPAASAAVAGALAAATADTWASEVGRAVGGRTWILVSGETVPPGTSGGVSVAGSAAGALGAAVVAGAALLGGHGDLGPAWLWVAPVAGVAGGTVDSVLGATLERRLGWWDNEAVNTAATAVGAGVAVALAAA